jgi:hypothetical protein
LDELKHVVKIPEAWLLALVIFFNYAIIITQRYVAPFFTEVFLSTVAIAAIVGYIRKLCDWNFWGSAWWFLSR